MIRLPSKILLASTLLLCPPAVVADDKLTVQVEIPHVHIADHPGRHEPGSGTMDWRGRLEWLAGTTYPGMLGLEYKPTGSTEASLKTLLER